MKSAAAISANYLQRVADPACRFYADYLEYKKGGISSAQLVARLPHIAMIGDSLSRNVYVSSALSTFCRARRYYGNDWFFNAAEPASGGQLLHSPEYRFANEDHTKELDDSAGSWNRLSSGREAGRPFAGERLQRLRKTRQAHTACRHGIWRTGRYGR